MLRKVLIAYVSLMFAGGGGVTPAASAQSTIPRNQRVTIEFVSFDEKTGIITFALWNQTAWDINCSREYSLNGPEEGRPFL